MLAATEYSNDTDVFDRLRGGGQLVGGSTRPVSRFEENGQVMSVSSVGHMSLRPPLCAGLSLPTASPTQCLPNDDVVDESLHRGKVIRVNNSGLIYCAKLPRLVCHLCECCIPGC